MNTKVRVGWVAGWIAALVIGMTAARADFVTGHERLVGHGVGRLVKNVGFESVRQGSVELQVYRTDGLKGYSRVTLNLDRGHIDFLGVEARPVECGSVLLSGVSTDGRFQLQVLDHSARSCKDLPSSDPWQVRIEEVKNFPTDHVRMIEFGTSIQWLITTMSNRAPVIGNRFR